MQNDTTGDRVYEFRVRYATYLLKKRMPIERSAATKTMRAIAAVATVLMLQFDVAHQGALRRAHAQNILPGEGAQEGIQAKPWEARPWEGRPWEGRPWEARPWEGPPGEARPRALRRQNAVDEQRGAERNARTERLGQETKKIRKSVDQTPQQFNRSEKWQRHHKDTQRFNPGGLMQ